MTRSAEAALLIATVVVAGMGVALVNFASGGGLDAQVALTLLVFSIAIGAIHMAVRRWAPHANPFIFPLAMFLTAIGFIEIYRLDSRLVSIQRWSLLVGAAASVALLYALRDDGVALLRRFRYLFLFAAVLLLLLPLLPSGWPLHGIEVNGSRLWVKLEIGNRYASFQPGEVAKVLLIVFLASYLAERHIAMAIVQRKLGRLSIPEPRQLGPVIIAAGASFVILVYQRDLGAALLLFTMFVGMTYLATSRMVYPLAGSVLGLAGGLAAYRFFDHVQVRFHSWLNPWDDFAGSGFQIIQGLFAIGSGSLTGAGLGSGRPDLIPAAETDFIFAAVAEELGFGGAVGIITAYALLAALGFGIALRAREVFLKILAAGLILVVTMQAILILAGILRLLPVTGITLPFMSYGGSSLVANILLLTLLARVSHEVRP